MTAGQPKSKRFDSFETKVLNTIKRRNLIKKGDRILIAFSGGPDSTALSVVLRALSHELDLSLVMAHINHGLHDLADVHQEHSRMIAEKLGVEFVSETIDVRSRALNHDLSIEHAARLSRYEALDLLANMKSCDIIATGHTATDRVETVLLNLVRGTGPYGLVGVPPRRDRIIRPLIDVDRVDIESYLKRCNICLLYTSPSPRDS